jgi:flagellar protein FlaG
MAMEITGVANASQPIQDPRPARPVVYTQETAPNRDVKDAIQKLTQVGLAFNRRLQFSVNDKSNEVVVKVIDEETDKVIKEIPARELQIVHERIKEALGLLIDERI